MARTIRKDDPRWIPYRGPRPADARPEIVIADVLPEDPRLWVPLSDKGWTRPLSSLRSDSVPISSTALSHDRTAEQNGMENLWLTRQML